MSGPAHITVRVPTRIRRRPGRRTMVTPVVNGLPAFSTRADPALVTALARGFRYQKLLDEGRYASISEMSEGERIERAYLGTLLRLTLLAPDIAAAVLSGRCRELTGARALGVSPVEWGRQGGILFV